MATGYDAAKATAFNKLKQQGLSDDQALAQAGISAADIGNYALGMNGQMGPLIIGGGKVAGVDYEKYTPAELAEQARFDQGLQSVNYDETARSGVSSVTQTNYTSVSTETVSGGGSTSIVAGPRVANSTSRSLQPVIDAKQAEISVYQKNNPSDFVRERQGLAPLSEAEKDQRDRTLLELNKEKAALKNQQIDSESTSSPTISIVPNTTTTTETVTTGVAVTRESVDYNNDAVLSQQTELRLETTTTTVNANSATDSSGESSGYGSSYETNELGNPLPVYPSTATDYATGQGGADGVDLVYTESAAAFNDPYYGLTAQQLKDLGSADPTDPYIRARLGIPQLGGSTLNAGGFAALQPTGVPLIDNAVAAISNFASSLSSFFGVTAKPAVTTQGTTTGAPPPAVIDTKAVASDATAVKEQNPNLGTAATENLTNIQEANVNTVRAEENIDINNRAILDNEQAQAQALEQQRQAQAYIDQNNAELADENLPNDRRAQLEANNAEQYANIAENAAVIEEAQTNIDKSTANNEQQANSILENQYVAAENAEAYRINTTGGVDENGDPVNNTANDPEFNDYGAPEYNAETDGPLTNTVVQELTAEETAALLDQAENPPPTDVAEDVVAEDTVEDVFVETDVAEDVVAEEDPELQEPPGTEGEIADLAEPVDPESDPELLAGEEEEPFTELAEPPDPDATPELDQLAGEEDLGPYTELAEPPTDEPEQLGDPALEDGEITDLAEPVDPDADPELVQLGDPALQEEADTGAEQLSGPTDVDPNADPGVSGGLSDEEQQARQNPGGLSDEELIARQAAAEQAAAKATAINQATQQSRYKQPGNSDWRVRLALAPSSFYLYNVLSAGGSGDQGAGILAPLAASNGVIFPYMPQISTMYRANYEQYDLVHSNFRGVYYKSSRVDDIQIRGTFTAQDTTEAQYLLAVIHFFRSVTKMFYGKDAERGTPPPLVYLSGLGDYQFSKHPCLVSQFSYTLPNDVDYIRATNPNDYGGNLFNRRTPTQASPGGINFAGARRLANALTPSGKPLPFGATPQTPQQNSVVGRVNNTGDFSTYVPTMMEIDIVLVPVQTRSQVSKQFSLKDFANGNLLKGGFW